MIFFKRRDVDLDYMLLETRVKIEFSIRLLNNIQSVKLGFSIIGRYCSRDDISMQFVLGIFGHVGFVLYIYI